MTSINNNTENLDLYEKVNFLFKNYLGFPNTDKTKPFFQEVGVKANNYLYGSELFLDDIPISPNFNTTNTANTLNISSPVTSIQTDSTGVIRKFTKLKLQKISGTNRGFYCLDDNNNNILSDAIQFNKVTDAQGNRPYLYELFDYNQEQLFPGKDTGNWIFDVKNGVVNFPDETTRVSDTKLPYLTFYKYIGRKGISNIRTTDIQGFSDSTNNINLLISDISDNVYNRSHIDSSFNYLKTYTDNVASGLDIKESVKLATNSSLNTLYYNGVNGVGATLTSVNNEVLTIDDVSNNNINDRILVKNQTDKKENGIYVIKEVGSITTKFKLQRAVPDDEGRELTGGSFVFVEEGSKNANNGFVFTNNGTPNIGVDNIDIAQFSGAGQLIMGRGLEKDGNRIFIEDDIYNRFSAIDTSFNNFEILTNTKINNLETSIDNSFNILETRIDTSFNILETNVDTSFNLLETRVDTRFNNFKTTVDTSFNVLETRVDASFNNVYTKSFINDRINTLQNEIDISFNNVYTKNEADTLFLTGLTINQDSDISNNRGTRTNINTISFDYDSGLKVIDVSAGEVQISLGSHWKEIKINDASGIIPSGEETLNLKTGTGISIIPNGNDNPQSLTFSIDAEFTDLSGVPNSYISNKGKYLRVNENENRLEFAEIEGGNGVGLGLEVVSELPTEDLSNNQIVVRSTDNTIHRYDVSNNEWLLVGGSPEKIEQNYSQISNFDVFTLNDGLDPKIVNYYDNTKLITEWNKIAEIKYDYISLTKQILISYNVFVSFNSEYLDSNVSGFGGRSGIMEWVVCLDDDIINNSRSYITVDLIEKYVNLKTVINFTENSYEVDLNKNLTTYGEKVIKIYARSIYNDEKNLIKLHQTENGTARPDNIEIISLSEGQEVNNKNITDYRTELLDINEEKIIFSEKNELADINDNWTCIDLIDNYLPPEKTKNIILRYKPFLTFKNDIQLGIRGENAVIEWVFKIGDIILPYSRQLIHLDLIERYFNIETNITIDEIENLDKNVIKTWDKPKNIKLFARSIMNTNSFVRLHRSQVVSELKRPIIEIISVNKNKSRIDLNSQNVIDFKSKMLEVGQETIKYSDKNLINDISDNWTPIIFIEDYIPPNKTKNLILKYTPFITFSNDTILGLRGRNAVIEWIFKIGDTFLSNSRQFIHLDLIEKYFTIETNIKVNSLGLWNRVKTIKLFARTIFNNEDSVRLHFSQVTSKIKKPQIELFSIANNNETSNKNIYQEIYTVTDNRYTHNEEIISNSISIIEQLTPKYYIKTNEIYDQGHNFELNNEGEPVDSSNNKLDIEYTFEAGLIAQDIFQISELQHAVEGFESTSNGSLVLPQDKAIGVNYNSILVYTIQALKEVISKNRELENKINDLESKINN